MPGRLAHAKATAGRPDGGLVSNIDDHDILWPNPIGPADRQVAGDHVLLLIGSAVGPVHAEHRDQRLTIAFAAGGERAITCHLRNRAVRDTGIGGLCPSSIQRRCRHSRLVRSGHIGRSFDEKIDLPCHVAWNVVAVDGGQGRQRGGRIGGHLEPSDPELGQKGGFG